VARIATKLAPVRLLVVLPGLHNGNPAVIEPTQVRVVRREPAAVANMHLVVSIELRDVVHVVMLSHMLLPEFGG
jgi:hypothetical protein